MTVSGRQDTSLPDALKARVTRAELAALWRVSVRTIERYEAAKIGPPPMRILGRVLYRREDVLAWERAQLQWAGD